MHRGYKRGWVIRYITYNMHYNVKRVQKGWVIKYITYNMQYNVNRVLKGWVIRYITCIQHAIQCKQGTKGVGY